MGRGVGEWSDEPRLGPQRLEGESKSGCCVILYINLAGFFQSSRPLLPVCQLKTSSFPKPTLQPPPLSSLSLKSSTLNPQSLKLFPTPNSETPQPLFPHYPSPYLLTPPPHPTGKPILVPLTTSLYVPGELADTENVIVDIGTGFYVEKVCMMS